MPGHLHDVNSLQDLVDLEENIASEIRRFALDAILLALRSLPPYDPKAGRGIPSHVLGVAARFATRYGIPSPTASDSRPTPRTALEPLLKLCAAFAHADPVGWGQSVPSSRLSIMLRHVGNQFPYVLSTTGKWGRAEILYNELPREIAGMKGVPAFDFLGRFEQLTGTAVKDFIDVGYMAYCAAQSQNHLGFARDWFEKARSEGMKLATYDVVHSVLNNFAADSTEHAELSVRFQQANREYAAYDYSSLMVFPLIRPWPTKDGKQMELDRMIAPVPDLVLYRLTSGVYYHMHDRWKGEFDQYFGHLLNAYVGRLLKGFVASGNLISENEIRRTYSASEGKAPDWIVLDGRTAILIEVKVARVHRIVYATGSEAELRKSLTAIIHGLEQLYEFRCAAVEHRGGLERLGRCREFVPVVITMETPYLSASKPFKDLLRRGLMAATQQMDWSILSIDDLEWAQTHLSGQTIDIASFFRHTLTANPRDVVNSAHKLSGRTFAHSMLHAKEEELHDRLGVPRVR